jgi:hypothetical protein
VGLRGEPLAAVGVGVVMIVVTSSHHQCPFASWSSEVVAVARRVAEAARDMSAPKSSSTSFRPLFCHGPYTNTLPAVRYLQSSVLGGTTNVSKLVSTQKAVRTHVGAGERCNGAQRLWILIRQMDSYDQKNRQRLSHPSCCYPESPSCLRPSLRNAANDPTKRRNRCDQHKGLFA